MRNGRSAAAPTSAQDASPRSATAPTSAQDASPRSAAAPTSVQDASPRSAAAPTSVQAASPRSAAAPTSAQDASPRSAAAPTSVQDASPRSAAAPTSVQAASPRSAAAPTSAQAAPGGRKGRRPGPSSREGRDVALFFARLPHFQRRATSVGLIGTTRNTAPAPQRSARTRRCQPPCPTRRIHRRTGRSAQFRCGRCRSW